MINFSQVFIELWQAMSWLELVAVLCGVVYVILAAKENILCWYAAFIGTGLSIYLFWDASLLMESALNVYYLLMAVVGWWQWRYGSKDKSQLTIQSWRVGQHIIAIGLIAVLTIISGYLLSTNTNAALPYVDSFTTWGAVLTTWMVTRKVLQNWLYWIVIDIVAVGLYAARDLYLYAILSVIYTVIAVFAYSQWTKTYQANVVS